MGDVELDTPDLGGLAYIPTLGHIQCVQRTARTFVLHMETGKEVFRACVGCVQQLLGNPLGMTGCKIMH
jgi:hypothetical protein